LLGTPLDDGEAVIDSQPGGLYPQECLQQGQVEQAVGDGLPKWSGAGALGIDVDRLVVMNGIGRTG